MDEHTETYTIQVHEEDDSYWAEVEELPGCFASGDSIEELWSNLSEAIGLYLSSDTVRVEVELQQSESIKVHAREQRFAICS
ncbi:type II toxin-antitoxin system HicB family antitoxin [Streptosporangium sp. NPDC051022]|uniref:type II toxin-antitoxin system HicB family antitoxin n=1 Tax=Streptosporangium sp. NPDC051022 TaxID=3155752 RepID=UPI003446EE76